MNNPRAVALKFSPITVTLLRIFAAARFAGLLRERRQGRAFGRLHLFAVFPPVRRAHWFDVDLSSRNFSRNARFARFASSLTASKSKIASSIAVSVSQMHAV